MDERRAYERLFLVCEGFVMWSAVGKRDHKDAH